jgi:hypothetical protein
MGAGGKMEAVKGESIRYRKYRELLLVKQFENDKRAQN